jgi:hypothetical protein
MRQGSKINRPVYQEAASMKGIKGFVIAAGLAFAVAFTFASAGAQSLVTQTVSLNPGWNAVFLEVQPISRDPAAVFEGLEHLESVWTWLSRMTAVEFIQDPGEGLWGQPGWHAWFPPGDAAFLSNLYAVLGNQAYLIKIGGTDSVQWQVSGSPSVRKIRWVPDSFNLTGFHVKPAAGPPFADFLTPSAAHVGQAVYRLNNSTGQWGLLENPAASIEAGKAYWVYCEGSSTYQGPLRVELPMSGGLHFGESLTRLTLTLTNLSTSVRTAAFALSGSVILHYRQWDPATGYYTWRELGDMPAVALPAESSRNVWLEVRRDQMPAGLSESVLAITDDQGVRIRVPVSAVKD